MLLRWLFQDTACRGSRPAGAASFVSRVVCVAEVTTKAPSTSRASGKRTRTLEHCRINYSASLINGSHIGSFTASVPGGEAVAMESTNRMDGLFRMPSRQPFAIFGVPSPFNKQARGNRIPGNWSSTMGRNICYRCA